MQVSNPQHIYLNGLNKKYRGFVGGYGSGKTFVACLDLINFMIKHPKQLQGYFAPTYRDIRDIFYPTFDEACAMYGMTCDTKVGYHEVHVYKGRYYYGTIICRAMFVPQGIIGFKIVRAIVDEIDVLPKDKADTAWMKIIGRLRLKIDGVLNDVGVTTTPEGFGFVYDKFAENPEYNYSMVQASSYENEEFLPEDYISSLLETYPERLVEAYVMGQFVNMRSGTVFYGFDRTGNNTDVIAEPKEALKIGMDFNVEKMAACVYVIRDKVWHQIAEHHHIYDTPDMIKKLNEVWKEHPKTIYPDASGKNRSSNNASISDIKLLKAEGWEVRVKPTNPLVRDRVLSANLAYEKKQVMVNVERCPETTKCLEQLAYGSNGEPDKSNDLDHQTDAATYPIFYEMPVTKPASRIQIHRSV